MSKTTVVPDMELFEFEEEGLDIGYTTIQNLFFTHFMPKANGNFVKVYLAGLMRCYGAKVDQWASAGTIAEEQNMSKDTVRRAWRYWEELGLVRRIPRYARDKANPSDFKTVPDEDYRHQLPSIIRFRRNLQALINQQSAQREDSAPPMQGCTPPLCNSAHPPYAGLHTKELQCEEIQVEQRQDKTVGSGPVGEMACTVEPASQQSEEHSDHILDAVIQTFCDILNRPATKLEHKHLKELLADYGRTDLENAFNELIIQLSKQRIDAPTRYLSGVLQKWASEGPRMSRLA